MRLPAGRRELALDVGGAAVPLGAVDVPAGGLALHSVRLWGSETATARTASF
jgi:hypothetical protein